MFKSEDFSVRLEESRRKLAKNQRDMADAMGVSFSTYQRYAAGTQSPRVDEILKLGDMLDLNYLLTGNTNQWQPSAEPHQENNAIANLSREIDLLKQQVDEIKAAKAAGKKIEIRKPERKKAG